MEVTRIRALRGPNLWSHHTAIQSVVSCSDAECSVGQIDGFEARLRARFPEISPLQPTGHDDSIPMSHVLELAALELQAQAGCPVTFSCCTPTVEAQVFQVVVEYSEEAVGRLALELAQNLCQAAMDNEPFDLAAALTQLRELDEDVRLGPSTGCIVNAAVARNIPYSRMTEGSMVRFGWGSKQRRIQAAEMDVTSAIAEAIAQDKDLTKKLLAAAGVPVPTGREVSDAEDAWKAACEIGLPVVVKPNDGNQGKGVTVNITSREQLLKAYEVAREFRNTILVERYMPGNDFRLIVVGDKMVAAARRDPPKVVGDGVLTIAQLVDQVNLDPRRGSGHSTSLTKIRFDDIARSCLATQGLTAESIPV
ncbi:MAG: cyanophycin synthetase family protein, partial [Rhodoferax sp.]